MDGSLDCGGVLGGVLFLFFLGFLKVLGLYNSWLFWGFFFVFWDIIVMFIFDLIYMLRFKNGLFKGC